MGFTLPEWTSVTDDCYIKKKVHPFLSRHHILLNIIAFTCGFVIYFSMYAYRKGFTAADYRNIKLLGLSYKMMLVILQLAGYILSKFCGIVIISSLDKTKRAFMLVALIGFAEISLILFGITKVPYNAFWMFFNGLPLGLIWGLVFSYLEGRRTSELLGSGMCISFIISSAIIKTIAKEFISMGYSDFWVPAIVGAIFYPILCLFTFFIELVPPPDEEDIKSRTERVAMTHEDRVNFIKSFWPGLTAMIIFYMLICGLRDFRDNFMRELFTAMGETESFVFTKSELIVAVIIIIPVILLMFVKNHLMGFFLYHVVIAIGFGLLLFATVLYEDKLISGVTWMIVVGAAIYIGFVPYSSIIFDRQIAAFKVKANSGFLVYIADSLGYATAIIFMLLKEFGTKANWLGFFKICSYFVSIAGIALQMVSLVYYYYKSKSMLHIANENAQEILLDEAPSHETHEDVMLMEEE
ncbi:hypothetical protein TVAG_215230 [Trichomonas vaginalis G3]|uniref:Major Facilitator Superfamily protein n=1 Tax=Trichomonas vaginalis (strain ATCC PRA-98 / G3) TaxID=412133 RepID=A2F653_TRIV3|nr:Family of unknown function (DUF5690) family [Trichomonas vaginalis G3]EAX99623.1 hypothetical protein TVAG_215230 [Trichomonas vaginalis G3]KAI5532138.1 Family of unknown function (DUF5690) family [Trichomonas vaginalis G3]|eukprot:XP_001312553.1 hypothetical protein [Trichomonas vaginalis G3]